VPPSPALQGRKDVVLVPGGMGTVRFITKFENFANDTVPYMYHCHMLTHEDGGMMGQFIVQDPQNKLEEVSKGRVKIYPNPSNALLHFVSDFSLASVKITDFQGRFIEKIENLGLKSIDISSLKKGIYSIEIFFSNGQSYHDKFIRE
jgi:bilirubin oxidase